jgi:hypothetical protein
VECKKTLSSTTFEDVVEMELDRLIASYEEEL